MILRSCNYVLLFLLGAISALAQSAQAGASAKAVLQTGNNLFQQNCAFCHGRDAGGGETGPDLTSSKLVAEDVEGNKIKVLVRNGVPDKGMPPFALPDGDLAALAAFIHDRKKQADSQVGGRRGVDVADLQTGDVEAGKLYFNSTGGCAACHSATGDLAGIAKRFEGLKLEQRMLYPGHAQSKVTVTLPKGKTVAGTLAYKDEFTIALRDETGHYRSWLTRNVKFAVDAPVEAHVDLLAKYSDADIHNLMAYLQTFR